jgi:two-component system sensor histidine kinase BarA
MKLPEINTIFAKILLTALPPIVLLAVVMSYYAIDARLDDLDRAVHERGQASAQQLASTAVLGLFTGDRAMLQHVSQQQLALSPDIDSVLIHDRDGQLVARALRITGTAGERVEFHALVIPPTLDFGEDPASAASAAPIGEVVVRFNLRSASYAQSQIVWNAVLITAIAVILTIAVAVVVARQIARPIARLRHAVSRIQEGDLESRVAETSTGEIGELQRGFNAMADQIASSSQTMQREVENATADLQQTMDALEIRNIELEQSRRRERDANQAKSQFLANISHEIRTPMNGVLGFAGLLQKSRLDDTQRDFLDTIIRSGNNLLAIINDILDFSKMEAGRIELEQIGFSLRDMVEDVVRLLLPQANDKGIRLISVIDSTVHDRLIGDVTRLRQVLTNLLGNAVKFTEQGEVVVRVRSGGLDEQRCSLEISVEDSGVGIPAEVMQELFVPFSQGAVSTKRLYGGTGLGLSICRNLVEAMGGSIGVQSEPGRGSRFTVTLTLPVDSDHAVTQGCSARTSGLSICLVDPHSLSCASTKALLEREGFGVAALDRLPEAAPGSQPDLWLLSLAGARGQDEVLSSIERVRGVSAAPICVLLQGGGGAAGLAEFARLQGACDLLQSPVTRERLVATVVACVCGVSAGPESRVSASPDPAWLAGRTIVVADDNDINLKLMDALLRMRGALVRQARDGGEAVRIAREETVDLVVMDIHMPRLDGQEAAARIHALAGRDRLPIIALTADGTMEAQLTGPGGHFAAFLTKPIEEGRLMASIAQCLGGTAQPVARAPLSAAPVGEAEVRDEAEAIRLAGNSESLAGELFNDLLEQLPVILQQLHASYGADDWDGLWQSLHKLRGACAVCGVPALQDAADRLNDVVVAHEPRASAQALSLLQREADRLVAWHAVRNQTA